MPRRTKAAGRWLLLCSLFFLVALGDGFHHIAVFCFQIKLGDQDKQTDKHRQRNIQAEGVDAVADGGRDDLHIAGKAHDSQDPADQRSADAAGHLAAEAGGGGGHTDDLVVVLVVVIVHCHAVQRTAKAHHGDGGKAAQQTHCDAKDKAVRLEAADDIADDAQHKGDFQGLGQAKLFGHRADHDEADKGRDQAHSTHNADEVVIAQNVLGVVGAGGGGQRINDIDQQVCQQNDDPVFVVEQLVDGIAEGKAVIGLFLLCGSLLAGFVEDEQENHAQRADNNRKFNVGSLICYAVGTQHL